MCAPAQGGVRHVDVERKLPYNSGASGLRVVTKQAEEAQKTCFSCLREAVEDTA